MLTHHPEVAPEQESEGGAPSAVDDELAIAAHRQADVARLRQEAARLRSEMASFEAKYRMSIEEYRAQLSPTLPLEQQADYLAWSELAEQYRLVMADMARLGHRPR